MDWISVLALTDSVRLDNDNVLGHTIVVISRVHWLSFLVLMSEWPGGPL